MNFKEKISRVGPMLMLIGFIIGLYSSLITTIEWENSLMENVWENRLFFRGVLLGFLLISIGSAAIVENVWIRDGIISLGSGIISLLFISTLNLLIDNPEIDWIKTHNYFKWTFRIIGIVFIILIILRLWLNRLFKLLRF